MPQTEVGANAGVFNRLNGSLLQMGGTQQDTLRITELLGKAIKVSGASGVEASSAMVQFGQALGSGKLAGDELRSLLENAPYLMRQLADGLGVPIGALKQLGEDGKLLRLQVARRPVNPLNRNALDAEPEVPDEYHLDLLEWATWRALRNHDADIDGDPANISIVMARSSSHKKRFDEAVAECKRKNKYMNTQHVEFGVRANWS